MTTDLTSILTAASQSFTLKLGDEGVARRDAKRAAREALDAALPALTSPLYAGETDGTYQSRRVAEGLEARFRVVGRMVRAEGVEAAAAKATAETSAEAWIAASAEA